MTHKNRSKICKMLTSFQNRFFPQWAKIVVVLERGFSRNQLLEFQKMYAIKMMGPPKENLAEITEQVEEQRGLMVIKTSSKTKARQRKGAISNWKVGPSRAGCVRVVYIAGKGGITS